MVAWSSTFASAAALAGIVAAARHPAHRHWSSSVSAVSAVSASSAVSSVPVSSSVSSVPASSSASSVSAADAVASSTVSTSNAVVSDNPAADAEGYVLPVSGTASTTQFNIGAELSSGTACGVSALPNGATSTDSDQGGGPGYLYVSSNSCSDDSESGKLIHK